MGVAAVCLAVVAIAAALAIGLRSRHGIAGETAKMDTIWIAIGLTVIALVCCCGLVAVAFVLGLPILPMDG